MKTIRKFKEYIKYPERILLDLDRKRIITLKDETFCKLKFKDKMGYNMDLNNPKSFNEKLNYLKLYDRKDIYIKMVDKYLVKDYVSNIIGYQYIIPTLGVYDSFDEIDFSKLPNQFVIKCNHNSGGIVICKDKSKLDINEAKNKINKTLKKNFYYVGREWPYKNVNSKIIIEKYMIDKSSGELYDYKFFCFNGKAKFMKIDFDRFIKHKANYYDINGNLLKFGEKICMPDFDKKLNMPINFKKMIKLAEELSKGIPFLRVDFYEVNKKIYFGELTFYPNAGFGKFIPEEWDYNLGDLLDISCVKK